MPERTYLDDSPADDLRDVHPEDLDLEKIPQRLWKQTLAPFHRGERSGIVVRMHDERLKTIAWDVAYDLDMAESERGIARREARGTALRRTAAPLPSPEATHATARPTVQVNIRLRPDDHERLTEAARAVGLRPTTLARALVLNGAAQVLRDNAA